MIEDWTYDIPLMGQTLYDWATIPKVTNFFKSKSKFWRKTARFGGKNSKEKGLPIKDPCYRRYKPRWGSTHWLYRKLQLECLRAELEQPGAICDGSLRVEQQGQLVLWTDTGN